MLKTAYDITRHEDHLHVELEPGFDITLDAMRPLWRHVSALCEQTGEHRILIEGDHPTREMRRMQAIGHGRLVASLQPQGLRIAFCLHDYEPDFLSYFFTLVANGATHVTRFFDDTAEALDWLRRG